MNLNSPPPGNFLDPLNDLFQHKDGINETIAKFSLRKPSYPDDDICYIIPGNPDSLNACSFNSTSKTFLVIHGWTVSRDVCACFDMPWVFNTWSFVLCTLFFVSVVLGLVVFLYKTRLWSLNVMSRHNRFWLKCKNVWENGSEQRTDIDVL